MDAFLALVLLRVKLEVRALAGARERVVGLLFALPGLLLFSVLGSTAVFLGVHALSRARPDALIPALSGVATVVGLFWTVSPLLAGTVVVEAHDLSRLVHFPVPLRTLVGASLVANLLQPLVLAELPVALSLAVALAPDPGRLPFTAGGVLASFAFMLATAHGGGLVLHALTRSRRAHDLAVGVGLVLSFAIGLGPLLVIADGGRGVLALLGSIDARILVFSPFGWGVRAAAHAGDGALGPALLFGGAQVAALLGVVALSARFAARLHSGELDGGGSGPTAVSARMVLSGPLGALVEKDLRAVWREPALKTSLFLGLVGPVLFLVFATQLATRDRSLTPLLLLATFTGASASGQNAFGLERRGIGLLLALPVERWRILVAKDIVLALLRLPAFATLTLATLWLAPPASLPVVFTVAVVMLGGALALDNFAAILWPRPLPAPGQSHYAGSAAGGRGMGRSALSLGLLLGSLVVGAPFAFLACLPSFLGQPGLAVFTIPLALLGALATDAMLVAAAGRLMEKREPEMLEQMLLPEA